MVVHLYVPLHYTKTTKEMENIQIETFKYFGNREGVNFNAKVLYRKSGKLYLAHVYVDFFNKVVYIPKQPKECKILVGFEKAINENLFPSGGGKPD